MEAVPSAIQRIAKAVLRSCLLTRGFKVDLPPEIWVIIFDLLIEPTTAPYKYCTSETFQYYQVEQFFPFKPLGRFGADASNCLTNVGYVDYSTHYFSWDNKIWLRISLVCREWANIVGLPRFVNTNTGKYRLHSNVQNMKCSYPGVRFDNPLDRLIQAPDIFSRLTTLEIRQSGEAHFGSSSGVNTLSDNYRSSSQRRSLMLVGNAEAGAFGGVNALLDNSQAFPMLRSLRIDFLSDGDMPQFWSRLEEGFPNLISLALLNCPFSLRTIGFTKLEIFMYRSGRYGQDFPSPKLRLPSLKHCAIDQSVMSARRFILDHGHQLESLSFYTPGVSWFPIDFWEIFPQLLMLQVRSYVAEPIGHPNATGVLLDALPPLPPEHPLRRLVLYGPFRHQTSICIEGILAKLPTIRHLSITQTFLDAKTLSRTRRVVARHGVRFDVHAVSAQPRRWLYAWRFQGGRPLGSVFTFTSYVLLKGGQYVFVGLVYGVNRPPPKNDTGFAMPMPLTLSIPLERSMPGRSSTAKAVLRKCRLMQPFRFDFPPEIWIMIFELVLEPTVAPYKYCTSENFSHYQAEQLFFFDSEKYSAYLTEHFPWNNTPWLRISLVCHAWANMVGLPPFLDATSGKYRLRYNIRSMKCAYPGVQFDNPLEKMVHAPDTSNRLTTLEIRQTGNSGAESFVGVNALLDNYTTFPMLRSLHIEFRWEGHVPGFWSRLEKGFPNLISLALTNCSCSPETITFAKLEIFMYQSYHHDQGSPTQKLQLPRLKHCTIDQGYMNSRQFILDHGHQLESLCFHTSNSPSFPADFWELFPKLSTLEVGGNTAEPCGGLNTALPPLPSDHPLDRLVLHLSSSYVDAVSVGGILGKIPTIRHLSITQSYFQAAELSKTRRIVTQHGVKFDVHAVVVMFPSWRRLMDHHPWGPVVGLGTYLLIISLRGLFWGLIRTIDGVICCCDRVAHGYTSLYRKLKGEPAMLSTSNYIVSL